MGSVGRARSRSGGKGDLPNDVTLMEQHVADALAPVHLGWVDSTGHEVVLWVCTLAKQDIQVWRHLLQPP